MWHSSKSAAYASLALFFQGADVWAGGETGRGNLCRALGGNLGWGYNILDDEQIINRVFFQLPFVETVAILVRGAYFSSSCSSGSSSSSVREGCMGRLVVEVFPPERLVHGLCSFTTCVPNVRTTERGEALSARNSDGQRHVGI